MKFSRVVPVLRTFDTEKATQFYVDYLGMSVDWEHRFEPGLPLYRQVSRGDLVLHLTEHHGDSTPGSVVYTYMRGVRDLHAELAEKASVGHNNPGLESVDGRTEVQVVDPFGKPRTLWGTLVRRSGFRSPTVDGTSLAAYRTAPYARFS